MKKILALSLCVANSSYVISSPTPGDATHNTLAIVNKHLFYGSRLNLSTDYQNKSRSFIFFDGFLPFSGDNNNIWFADVRFLNREQGASEGNVGLGYRHQMDTHPWIAGAYGFVDRRRSFDNNFFSELTVGGELKGVDWTLGTNFYVPVGQTVKADPYAFNATLTPAGAAGIYTINYNEGKEASLTGFDVEAGHAIPKVPGLMAYVGGYGYPSAHGVSSRVGPLVRAEYNLSDSGLLGEHPLMDSTVIEGFMRHDNFIGTSYYVGLKFGLNLDGTPRYDMDPIHRRMVDPVWHDIDLITAS
ncbi:MAG: inverse autotransporter beta domain-containing protein, partial [bacterium]|nr:inverse autotransporter beta domain-containing protein [bacterium]